MNTPYPAAGAAFHFTKFCDSSLGVFLRTWYAYAMNTNTLGWWLYGAGLLIVVATHVYMLVAGLPEDQMMPHAVLNLVAGALLAAGWVRGR